MHMSPCRYILAALLSVLCLAAPAQSRRDIAALDSLVAVSDSAAAYRLDLKLLDLSGASGRGGTIAWEDKAKIRKAQ